MMTQHKEKLYVRFVKFHGEIMAAFMRHTAQKRYVGSGSGSSWVRKG